MNRDNDDKFHHNTRKENRKLRTEYERLQLHKLETIGQRCRAFLRRSQQHPLALSLATFNIQSLNQHHEDLTSDFVLTHARILVLVETWLDNEDCVRLDNFRCITQFKRNKVRAGGVCIYEKKENQHMSTEHELLKCVEEIKFIKQCSHMMVVETSALYKP
jgi:hypothetical protein